MNELIINKDDEMVMKLLYYFITEQNYNPIILHGAKNEIWLENQNGPYKIIRIVTNYIHNDEQFNYDILRTKQIMKKIKKKTFNINASNLSIFLNIGDNVHTTDETNIFGNVLCANIKKVNDLKKYNFIIEPFPNITDSINFKEKGTELFMKLTKLINEKSEQEAKKADDVFKIKKPIITYTIIILNVLIFILMSLFGYNEAIYNFGSISSYIRNGEYYRLLTCMFMHGGLFHLLFNCYALYVIGPQIESFFGKVKFSIIYLASGLIGGLLSMLFNLGVSVGASGAVFGLLGSLLYFGYHYRVYLGGVIKSQIIPLIMINLIIGFASPGIDNAAHIGGLVGGILTSMALGVKYKSENYEKINGLILLIILIVFLIYMNFFNI